ncbi:MAG: DUF1304 domain-containing protein [Deltaproteobacteria bacterium]|nr:DUF1304 domain-containing protein [Deltaproteobacteria bacterium]
MSLLSTALAGLVALLHVYFLVLEMFLWATPFGAKTFGRRIEEQRATKVLAANQGLYNGFLAAGLIWSMLVSDADLSFSLRAFFLSCVIIAGVYGGATASTKIIFVQAVPAVLAFGALWLAK